MFEWSDKRIYFFKNASEYLSFNREIAKKINDLTDDHSSIADIACGLGYLSIELAKYFDKVYSIDISEDSLNVLRENIKDQKIDNIEVIKMDCNELSKDMVFSNIVLSNYGDVDETIKLFEENTSNTLISIKKISDKHRFTVKNGTSDVMNAVGFTQELDRRDIQYKLETIEVEEGQPFIDEADAVDFFNFNRRDDIPVTWDDIKERVKPVRDKRYSLMLSQIDKLGLTVLNK